MLDISLICDKSVTTQNFGNFLIIGTERNVCRCTFNRNSFSTQFEKLATGEQLCSRCIHRKLWHFKSFKSFYLKITNFWLVTLLFANELYVTQIWYSILLETKYVIIKNTSFQGIRNIVSHSTKEKWKYINIDCNIRCDQKVSVHLMITIQKSGAQRIFDHTVLAWKVFQPPATSHEQSLLWETEVPVNAVKAYRGSRGKAPFILNFGATRWVAQNCALVPFSPREIAGFHSNGGSMEFFEERKKIFC